MPGNQVRVGVGVTGAKGASSDLDKLRDKFDKLQKQGAKGILGGVAAGATVAGIGLATQALSGLTDVMGDSIKAALEDEASIQRLGTSLKSNIPAWDGNTKAIEGVIKARMALGFSDEDQRNALAKTVAATHDVSKALAVQSVAMDLARFKGISLEEASDALTKVEAGQYRILKSLGIQLPKNATATQALAAVEAVAANQAEDYAKTNEGKLLVSQVKVNEAMEKFGYKVMPVAIDAAVGAADAASGLVTVLDTLTSGLADTNDGIKEQLGGALDLGAALGFLNPVYGKISQAEKAWLKDGTNAATGVVDATQAAQHDIDRSLTIVRSSLDLSGDAADDLSKRTDDLKSHMVGMSHKVETSFSEMRQSMVDDARAVVSDAYAIMDAMAAISADKAKQSAAERVLASKTATDAEKADAKSALKEVTRDQIDQVLTLSAAGKTSSKTFAQAYNDLKEKLKTAVGQERVAIMATINEVHRLNRIVAAGIPNLKLMQSIESSIAHNIPSQSPGPIHRASGGPVTKGVPYIVGENRPEVFVPQANGRIDSKVSTGSGGGGMTVNLTVMGDIRAETPEKLVAVIKRLQDVA